MAGLDSFAAPPPRYDAGRSYDWNYERAPDAAAAGLQSIVPGDWRFCGIPVDSPLGIAAGPLLNSRWLLYYAGLGFDVLTYKTVRSSPRECFPLPNLQPVSCGQLSGEGPPLPSQERMSGSWAVSFGMPSQSPEVWRTDVALARRRLPAGKVLSVSVVGSVRPDWGLDELASDYARCARWAVESGAHCVETNFSCPNVSTCDGQLYQQPRDAAVVAAAVRQAIGVTPYVVKIGHMEEESAARELIAALAPHAHSLAMTNSVAAKVVGQDGRPLFDGERRGICGEATRDASLEQTGMFARLIREAGCSLEIVGVGGVAAADHVRQYLAAGATAVHLATAAMIDPLCGLSIRRGLGE